MDEDKFVVKYAGQNQGVDILAVFLHPAEQLPHQAGHHLRRRSDVDADTTAINAFSAAAEYARFFHRQSRHDAVEAQQVVQAVWVDGLDLVVGRKGVLDLLNFLRRADDNTVVQHIAHIVQ